MSLFLAIDAGGTRTRALLADGADTMAQASSGSIKTLRVPVADATASLDALFAQLTASAGVSLHDVTSTCVGISGIAVPRVRRWLREEFGRRVGGELLLLGDEVIALDAAFPGAPGILVIAGTGSNVLGRGAGGELARAGGWGPALADEGSGHWIGHQALRATFRECDAGLSEVPLLTRVLAHLALEDVEELIEAANAPGFPFAQLVPLIAAAARDGDPVALRTLTSAGEELASLVSAVAARLQAEAPAVACTGSILKEVSIVREAMFSALRRTYPGAILRADAVDPLEGALWHARRGHHPAA